MTPRRTTIFIACLYFTLGCLTAAQADPGRQRILLDASWRFHRGDIPGAIIKPSGIPVTHWIWVADDTMGKDAAEMTSPSLNTGEGGWAKATVGEDVFHGQAGFAWFRTDLPAFNPGTPVLYFKSVDDNATIYLNGKRLLSHEGWNESFSVDLKPAWKQHGPNLLAVLVENTAGPGGIYGGVYLQKAITAYQTVEPAKLDYNDRSWSVVHVPNDYIVEGKFSPTADRNHGYLPVEPAWYRKTFYLPISDRNKSLWVTFDGIYRDSIVWLNGHYLGEHPSGYTSFHYDITPYARYGGRNVLAIHVDPSQFEGWWYEGGGIYRHVWLNVADRLHIAPWGIDVITSLPEPKTGMPIPPAKVSVRTTVENDSRSGQTAVLKSLIVDDTDKTVEAENTPLAISPGKSSEIAQVMTITHPRLWSITAPHLYRLVSLVQINGHTVDRVVTRFGIRTIRFDPDTGLYLNGMHVKIKGVCNHQDFAGLGIAVPDNLEYWRVKKLKEMGANAWRMSHNPPTPSLLDACDKLGMLVMDENRHVGDSKSNLADVARMVRRDRNHPCIIIWSMCNEEWSTQGTRRGAVIFKHMMAMVHKYDRTRPISCAMNGGWFNPGFSAVEDLLGVNYNYQIYDRFHQEHPQMPMFASETASVVTTRGEYVNDPVHTWVSSYNLPDGSWIPVAERPFIAGSFVWTGFDYKGEPTPYNWPDINSNFGNMDMCGFPKDNYYYYQSWWKAKPIVHIFPPWNWPGDEGQPIRVVAFSNCARVELFLNGKSLGVKSMPRYGHLAWEVPYEPGTLAAKGYDDVGNVTAATQVETTDAPAALRLSTDFSELKANGEDVAVVDAAVVDAQGRVVPTANNLIHFKVAGAGYLAGVDNGNPSDHTPDKADYRRAFNGLCAVVIGAKDWPGTIHLLAVSSGLKEAKLTIAVY